MFLLRKPAPQRAMTSYVAPKRRARLRYSKRWPTRYVAAEEYEPLALSGRPSYPALDSGRSPLLLTPNRRRKRHG